MEKAHVVLPSPASLIAKKDKKQNENKKAQS
jgi:hypothetical protein